MDTHWRQARAGPGLATPFAAGMEAGARSGPAGAAVDEDAPEGSPIRVLVVDDHPVVRMGVRALLTAVGGIAVVGEAEDGRQAVEEARRCDPQVILMDLGLPHLDGAEATRAILAERPEVGIVVLTGGDGDAQVLAAVEAGAVGYLAKTACPADLAMAIRRVASGEPWLSPRLTRKLLAHLKPALRQPWHERLTEREVDVLRRVAKGRSNQQIADDLHLAEVTVRTHVSHILGKLGVDNRVEAALHALRAGLARLDDA
jgi:DNA-binding NarL/FixJ family response regulator